MSGMSPNALKRCRSMNIDDVTQEGRQMRIRIQIVDPGERAKVVKEIFCTTEMDVTRLQRSFMGTYRVPRENIRDSRKKAE